jgi:hypothetical protein
MKDLYTRLGALGFDRKFVTRYVLPEWWEDSLAEVDANRAIAEMSVAQFLGIPVPQLRNRDQPLALEIPSSVRFQRRADTATGELDAAIALAQRAASGLVGALGTHTPFAGPVTAAELRGRVLSRSGEINLGALLQAAWDHGVAVLPMRELPSKAKRFTAAALLCGSHRVVVLASRRDAPPWLTFDLAHELGHIFLGHVTEESPVVVETGLEDEDEVSGLQDHEAEANTFALELLTGHREIGIQGVHGVTGPRLAAIDTKYRTEWRTAIGIVALVWGYRADRLAVANAALKLLGQNAGGAAVVREHFLKRLGDPEDLPETTSRYLALATGQ